MAKDTINKEIKPEKIENFNSVQALIVRIKRKEAIIIDFDGVPITSARRLLDYINGALYALSGEVNRLEDKQYLLIPKGVKITERKD
jgi:cell division inhibitor SepF